MAESSRQENVKEEYLQPHFEGGRYKHPWTDWKRPSFTALLKFIATRKDNSSIPKKEVLDETLPVLKSDLTQFGTSPETGVRCMWLGHASCLVQLDGVTILTDPIFSNRCSPSQWFGAKRYRPVPCSVSELPLVNCVVISHNHYDHLDVDTVRALNAQFGNKLCWYVPMGLKRWMSDHGCETVVELTWWEEHVYQGSNVKFVCTPCQHWSKRTATDDNKSLWCSWCVIGPKHKFIFVGDTGYCGVFKQIGQRYGPFNLSALPIGNYCPGEFLSPQHVDPDEAVDIHVDLGSLKSIGIHWGTFKMLSCEHYLEPRDKVKESLERKGMDQAAFTTLNHGEIRVF